MGVDIGVCKFLPVREEKIARLEVLRALPGKEGKKADEELDMLYDAEIFPECERLRKEIPGLTLAGSRMLNLYYSIQLEYTNIEFSFYTELSDKRVLPATTVKILNDMRTLMRIADDDEKESMEYVADFLQCVCDNDLVIYPS